MNLAITHKEADIIIIQHVIIEVNNDANTNGQVLRDDTGVFLLLIYVYWSIKMA